MPSFELTFGGRHFVVIVEGQTPATATMCMVVNDGRELRQIAAGPGGVPIELVLSTPVGVLGRARAYLAQRFGHEGPPPTPANRDAARTIVQPPVVPDGPARLGLVIEHQRRIVSAFVNLETIAADELAEPAATTAAYAPLQAVYRGGHHGFINAGAIINGREKWQRWLETARSYLMEEFPDAWLPPEA